MGRFAFALAFSLIAFCRPGAASAEAARPPAQFARFVQAPAGVEVLASPWSGSAVVGRLENLAEVGVIRVSGNTSTRGGIFGRWYFVSEESAEGWVWGGDLSDFRDGRDLDRERYRLTTWGRANIPLRSFGIGPRHYFAAYAHVLEIESRGRPEMRIFVNDTTQFLHLAILCNPNIQAPARGSVARVYFHRFSRGAAGQTTFIDHIEPSGMRFIPGHFYRPFEDLDIRDAPGASAPVIATVASGFYVELLEEGPEETINGIASSWARVRSHEGQVGWAFGRLLEHWNRPPVFCGERDGGRR